MGCKILKVVTWPQPHLLEGRLVVRRLKLDIACSHTKFDDSSLCIGLFIRWNCRGIHLCLLLWYLLLFLTFLRFLYMECVCECVSEHVHVESSVFWWLWHQEDILPPKLQQPPMLWRLTFGDHWLMQVNLVVTLYYYVWCLWRIMCVSV